MSLCHENFPRSLCPIGLIGPMGVVRADAQEIQEPRHRKAVELLSEVLDLLKANEGIAMAAME